MVKGWFLFDLLWCWLSKGETGARQQTQYGSDLDLTSLYRFYSSSSPLSSPSSSSSSPPSLSSNIFFQEIISFIPNTSPYTNMIIMVFLSFSHRDSINCEIWSCLRPLSTSTQNPEALQRWWRNKKTILIITVIQGLGWWVGHNASDWNNLRVRTLLSLKLWHTISQKNFTPAFEILQAVNRFGIR